MATLIKEGYGQIEPNHLSGQRNGQIYAQLPAASSIEMLHNGQFAKYDYAAGEVNYTGDGEWMLVYNEVKLYDPKHSYKDFIFQRKDFTDKTLFPRVFKTMPGDIITTNTITTATQGVAPAVGTLLKPGADGLLASGASLATDPMVWKVVKVYTMADGQPAVKIQRVK